MTLPKKEKEQQVKDKFTALLTNGTMVEADSCENKDTGHCLFENANIIVKDEIVDSYPTLYVSRMCLIWVGLNRRLREGE